MDQFQEQRNQEQDELERKFLVIPFSVLSDERLTPVDKLVYGRGLFFEEFFESATRTAQILGCSENQVKKSKQKLEAIGLLECISNDGRGKRYIAKLEAKKQGRVAKFANQTGRICHSEEQNLLTENKTESKAENKVFLLKDKSFNKAQEAPSLEDLKEGPFNDEPEAPKRYGNADVNEILDLWLEETGFDHRSTKQERFATNTLLRKYGCEATKALIRRVGVARRSDDQFAPQIAKPSQLVGKYEKLTALKLWEDRTAKAKAAEEPSDEYANYCRSMYFSGRNAQPTVDIRPSTPEEKAEVRRKAMEIRAKLPFYVPKDQRKVDF